VIIPAFNASAVVAEALASVAAQTYGDWEVVVADDGSTDDTAARAAAALPDAVVVRAESNGGPAAARNLALERASGELVAFLDVDDLWLPRYLERQVARYDDEARLPGPPVGIVACDAQLQDGTYMAQFSGPHEPLSLERVLARNRIYVSALVPRDAGEDVGWFAEELFGTEDHDLWIRILETGRAAVLNAEALVAYRVAGGSVSANLGRMAASYQRTLTRALGRGRLTAHQQRIARSELRYYRAMEAVARARFDRQSPPPQRARRLLAELPALLWVAATRADRWRAWAQALRHGRG
jgi:glycosyltransferase involved in cell wall biosynthesis